MVASAAEKVSGVSLEVRVLGPALGAEIRGLDLSAPLDAATLAEIKALWAHHQVLLFRDQELSEAGQVDFTGAFGPLAVFHEAEKRSSRRPEILRIGNVDEDGERIDPNHPTRRYFAILTALWHSDGSYKAIPSLGSALHALEVPPEGGETWFTNLYQAYEALPAKMKARLQGRQMVHNHEFTRVFAPGIAAMSAAEKAKLPPVTHPVVRTHEDGRKSLFLSENVAYYVGGMAVPEGQRLHRELIDLATQDRFVYRHKWRVGDLLLWDNRATMHKVTAYDAARQRRVMQRTEIMGSKPVI